MALTERDRFERCLREVLRHEGGWSNHPADPGGATMKGVTQRVYDAHRQKHGLKVQSVRFITEEELGAIYRHGYWLTAASDKLPAGLDLMVFDLAVNSGAARARQFLQASVGATVDGVIGPKTLAAVEALPAKAVIKRLRDRRENFYRSLPTFPTFGKGWLNRLKAVNERAMAWS